MRIVYINYLYDLDESSVGAGVHVNQLASALQECGHSVKICYFNRFAGVKASEAS